MGSEWKMNLDLMDEQTDFIMKMGTLIGNEFGKRFDYNEKRV